MTVVVVIPSRGRPDRAREALDAVYQTAVLVDTSAVLAVDADDPRLDDYISMLGQRRVRFGPEVALVILRGDETGDLVRATNTVSLRIAGEDPEAIIGNLGDDHLCRTPGWDLAVTNALGAPGIAYGDDLIHGERLPTAPFISAAIVNALGWYALPTCHHLYIDDAWRELGRAAGVLRYLPDVTIEHMHPAVRKADSDDGYVRANSVATVEHDQRAFDAWKATWLGADVGRIRSALNVWQGQQDRYPAAVE